MSESPVFIGRRIKLPGQVALESARPLGEGCECRVRLADGSPEEVVLSPTETLLIWNHDSSTDKPQYVAATDLQILAESHPTRLRPRPPICRQPFRSLALELILQFRLN